MARVKSWGYVVPTLIACGALIACGVETTALRRSHDTAEPSAPAADADDEPSAPSGAAPTGNTDKGTSGTSGTSGNTSSGGIEDGGGSDGSSGGPKDSGAPDASADSGTGKPSAFDAFQERNLAVINQYRATKSLVPLALDAKISAFALKGSQELAQNHVPHKHFATASDNGTIWQNGFVGSAAENQGDPNGWRVMSPDPVTNQMKQIDDIQKAMFDEGPGQGDAHGHYMNMMNPVFRRVGVGLLMVNGELYLTNDFSQ